ncbi:MAG: S4 domain-containing protein, partial [Pseudomonadota bacterium]|nr:S4 domain-containing protein [Pseudomonadota bacterium]
MSNVETEKLQKVLARAGVGSRREMEKYIDANRVSVNGKVARLGDRVEATDVIRVDGHVVKIEDKADRICRV